MNIFYWNEWDDVGENFEMYMNCEVLRDIGNDFPRNVNRGTE